MARFRDRLRMPARDRNDAVVIDDGPGTEIIVLDAVEEVVDGVEPGVLAATEPYPAATRRALRRERQALVAEYERQVMDLGGLVVEMARRGVNNHALVERRAADVVELERRIAELDGSLTAEAEVRSRPRRRAAADGADRGARPADCHALRDVPRAARQRRQLLRLLRRAAGAPVTDDEAFEEPVDQARCPNCLSAVEPDQQYCLECGERLAPAGPPPSSPLRGRTRPPATVIVAVGALLLLLGGFGIAYGFTRGDDGTKASGTTTGTTGSSTGGVVVPTFTITDTNQTVPTFTDIPTGTEIPTGTGFPTGTASRPAPTSPRSRPIRARPTRHRVDPHRPGRGGQRLARGRGRVRGDPLVRRHGEVHVRVDHGEEAAGDRERLRQRAAC